MPETPGNGGDEPPPAGTDSRSAMRSDRMTSLYRSEIEGALLKAHRPCQGIISWCNLCPFYRAFYAVRCRLDDGAGGKSERRFAHPSDPLAGHIRSNNRLGHRSPARRLVMDDLATGSSDTTNAMLWHNTGAC